MYIHTEIHTRVNSVFVCVGPPNVLTLETLFKLPICYSSCCWALRLFGSSAMGRVAIDSTPPSPNSVRLIRLCCRSCCSCRTHYLLTLLLCCILSICLSQSLHWTVSPICLAALSQNPWNSILANFLSVGSCSIILLLLRMLLIKKLAPLMRNATNVATPKIALRDLAFIS